MAHCLVQGCPDDRCIIALCERCYHYYSSKPYCTSLCCDSQSTCKYEQTATEYCRFHKCTIVWCLKVKGSTSPYCSSHCCTVPECNRLSVSLDYCPDRMPQSTMCTEGSRHDRSYFPFDDEEQYYYYEDWLD